MAPFTSVHHPLGYQWLPQTPLHIPSVKLPRLSTNMARLSEKHPVIPYRRLSVLAMLQKIFICLCEALRTVIHRCVSVAESLNMKIFFLCAEETMAMMGDSKRSNAEAQERPRQGWNSQFKVATAVKTTPRVKSPQVKIMMSVTEMNVVKPDQLEVDGEIVLSDWLDWETEEEQDESDVGNVDEDDDEEDTDTEWSEVDDSDWSDEEDSDVSTENEKLWESFLNNSDPYNPLYFSCNTGTKAKGSFTRPIPSSPSADTEMRPSADQHSTEQRTKKVRFSEEVTVHHLITWKFASWAARDGSCWMEQARDRERFRRRVEKAGEIITPCLTAQHRARVWDRLHKEPQTE